MGKLGKMHNWKEILHRLSAKSRGLEAADIEDAKIAQIGILRGLGLLFRADTELMEVEGEACCCGSDRLLVAHEELQEMQDDLFMLLVDLDPRFNGDGLTEREKRLAGLSLWEEYCDTKNHAYINAV